MRYVNGTLKPAGSYGPANIKLSDAILLGSVKHPQKFDGFYDVSEGRLQTTCGVVAALDCLGIVDEALAKDVSITASTVFPILDAAVDGCPACGKTIIPCGFGWIMPLRTVVAVIMHLNDDHHWTRPQQAEWVKTIENREAEKLQTQEAISALQTVEA